MKKTILFTLLALIYTLSIRSQTETFRLGFAGTYPEGNNYDNTKQVQWSWYPELSLNMWQGFAISDKQPEVLDSCNRYDMWAFFNPDTIIWAAFGKMAVHQAEYNTSSRFHYDYFWCGQDVPDSGTTVRYFNANSQCGGDNPSGIVLADVHEKFYQSYGNGDPMHEYFFKDTSGNFIIGKWYIKPRIRINSAEAFSDPPKNVCKVIVKAYNDTVVGEFLINTSNFRDPSGSHYNGEYLEEFYQRDIWVWADSLNRGRHEPGGNWSYWNDSTNCHVDYQIYWYGEVSMWLDYVKVMNRPAHLFFGSSQEAKDIRGAIKRKAETLVNKDKTLGTSRMKGFYTEEMDYSDLTCMKALNDSLAAWFPNDRDKVHIYGLINYETFAFCVRSRNGNEIQDYIDAIQPPYYMAIVYPFDGYNPWYQATKLPNNVSFQDPPPYYPSYISSFEQTAINSFKESFSTYNTYLQSELQVEADTLYYQYIHAKNSGKRFILCIF